MYSIYFFVICSFIFSFTSFYPAISMFDDPLLDDISITLEGMVWYHVKFIILLSIFSFKEMCGLGFGRCAKFLAQRRWTSICEYFF